MFFKKKRKYKKKISGSHTLFSLRKFCPQNFYLPSLQMILKPIACLWCILVLTLLVCSLFH